MNNGIPNLQELNKYNVNRYGEFEAVREPLYDFQTYVAAGQTSLTFFQTPIGQSGKTIEDTNMELAGTLPQPKNFLIQSIEIHFLPADDPVTLQNTATTALTVTNFTNDTYTALKLGTLDLFIGSKSYVLQGDLMRFPPKQRLEPEFNFMAQMKQAAAADEVTAIKGDYCSAVGKPWISNPMIRLIPMQNFSVRLTWQAVQVISADARIGIVMDGLLYRESQ